MNKVVLVLAAFSSAIFAQTATFNVFSMPPSMSSNGIVTGPDGNLWFTDYNNGHVGKMTPSGTFTEYATTSGNFDQPGAIIVGPDNNLWFGIEGNLVRITPAGVLTQFSISGAGGLGGVALGPDGAFWATDGNGYAIWRITTAGLATRYGLPGASYPAGIVAGPDGAMWFCYQNHGIGRITTSGTITMYPTASGTSPTGITVGSDGNLWFTNGTSQSIVGRITTAGVITQFPQKSGISEGITTGADGALYFSSGSDIVRMTTAGATTSFPMPQGDGCNYLTKGPDGNIWFTHMIEGGSAITQMILSAGPAILTGGILNGASYAVVNNAGAPVAPGSLAAIFTSSLSATAGQFNSATLPPSLNGVSVTFNGVTAPIVAVISPTGANPQVNVQVPFEAMPAGQTTATVPVVLTVNNTPSAATQATLVASSPGIFTIPPNGQGNAILVYSNNGVATIAGPTTASLGYPSAPIPRGTIGFFYVTGLGAMTPQVTDGSGTCPASNGLCYANAMPTVLVGGITAEVSFAGQAPGFPGVSQINVMIPQNAPTGSAVSMVVKSADGSVTSNTSTIAVQ